MPGETLTLKPVENAPRPKTRVYVKNGKRECEVLVISKKGRLSRREKVLRFSEQPGSHRLRHHVEKNAFVPQKVLNVARERAREALRKDSNARKRKPVRIAVEEYWVEDGLPICATRIDFGAYTETIAFQKIPGETGLKKILGVHIRSRPILGTAEEVARVEIAARRHSRK